jgi:hypothetical protein
MYRTPTVFDGCGTRVVRMGKKADPSCRRRAGSDDDVIIVARIAEQPRLHLAQIVSAFGSCIRYKRAFRSNAVPLI